MNASQLIRQIKALCEDNGRDPKDVTINYRHDSGSDVYPVTHTGKDKPFWMRTSCKVTDKPLTARQLLGRIAKNCGPKDKVSVRFNSAESENYPINSVEEDLFDSDTNNFLESICLVSSTDA